MPSDNPLALGTRRRSTRRSPTEIRKEKEEEISRWLCFAEDESKLHLRIGYVEGRGRGIFPTRSFQEGEKVVEYIGDLVDKGMATEREAKYSMDTSKGSYMFYFAKGGRKYW